MKIQTTRFGGIDIPEDQVIQVPDGILGFPGDKRYVLLEHDAEGTPFKWLQSVDTAHLAFIVMNPMLMDETYGVDFDSEAQGLFGASQFSAEEFAAMSIVNVPQDDPIQMTVNMRAPIVVQLEKRLGKQIILMNDNYSVRQRIFQPKENA